MNNTTRSYRSTVARAQALADESGRVFVVVGRKYIYPATDLDFDFTAERVNVVAPSGTFSGYSAEGILRAVRS